jgi:RHS repeat-associated protein
VGADTFAWDGLGRPWRATVSGVVRDRRWGGLVETDAGGAPRAIDLGELRIDLTGGAHRFRHFDHRGNVKLVSDAAGRLVAHVAYDAYGATSLHGAAADGEAPRFARGRELGALHVIGHRVYDPEAARFLAPDPVAQLVNAYAYALGNPVWFWDPSGQASLGVNLASAAAAIAGAAIGRAAGAATGAVIGGAIGGPPGAAIGALIGAYVGATVFGQAAGLMVYQAATGERGGTFKPFPGPGFASASSSLHAPSSLGISGAKDFLDRFTVNNGCGGDACVPAGTLGAGPRLVQSMAPSGSGCAPVAPVAAPDSRTLAVLAVANCLLAGLAWILSRRARR